MNNIKSHKQQGAVLFVALVMLLVLTALAVTSMGTVSLESRITANRAETERLQKLVEASLREGERRAYQIEICEFEQEIDDDPTQYCKESNKVTSGEAQLKPCVIGRVNEMNDDQLKEFFSHPVDFLNNSNFVGSRFGSGKLAWMPYRGMDPKNPFESTANSQPTWNAYILFHDAKKGEMGDKNREYYWLITSQINDEIVAHSTVYTQAYCPQR